MKRINKYHDRRRHYNKKRWSSPNNTKKYFINQLLENGWSPREIAQKYGFSRQYVNNLSLALGFRYRKKRRQSEINNNLVSNSLELELTGKFLKRYHFVRLFREYCFWLNYEWSMPALLRFENVLQSLDIDPQNFETNDFAMLEFKKDYIFGLESNNDENDDDYDYEINETLQKRKKSHVEAL